jgi:hypothetical protein
MHPLNVILLLMHLVDPATPILAGTALVSTAPAAAHAPDASESRPLTMLPAEAPAPAPLHAPFDAESPAAAIAPPCPTAVCLARSDGMPGSPEPDTDG